MNKLSIVALLLLGCTASAQDNARLLVAIGTVESGMQRRARGDGLKAYGAYQQHAPTWAEGNARLQAEGRPTYPLTRWRDPLAQDMVAAAFLRVLKDRLYARGILSPSPEVIALCWNRGVTGAAARDFRPDDYARRVGNIYRAL
jgi:hypothetical protein